MFGQRTSWTAKLENLGVPSWITVLRTPISNLESDALTADQEANKVRTYVVSSNEFNATNQLIKKL